ncbi:MAG: hypothetical protein ACR2KJ_13035 [Jatrophihabitans sp.]
MASTVTHMMSDATSRKRSLYLPILMLLGIALTITACAKSTNGKGSGSQIGSTSASSTPSAPTSGSSSGGVNTKKVTPPHIACLDGKQELTLDGAARPVEICLRVHATASITIQVPAGKSWDAPKVNDPAMLAASEQTAGGDTVHITIRAVDSGTASIIVTSAGATVWMLQVAIVT